MSQETISTIEHLIHEMQGSQREAEVQALREVLAVVAKPGRGWLTTGQAARRLGVSIPTVRDWLVRGALEGVDQGTRRLVSEASVERVASLRETLEGLDAEGNPTDEEARDLVQQTRTARRRATAGEHVA